MFRYFKYKKFYIFLLLVLLSFCVNFYVASNGVYPVDTFIHYDNGFRILLGDNPVKDYWIVHGFIIDYIQALFFLVFGNNWYSYLIHSSLFNVILTIFTFQIFKILKIDLNVAFLLSISFAFLAYPVSGTPFLDLHSSFFSLIGIYFAIIGIIKERNYYWFWTSILFCLAFFSKQVPAAYTIVGITFIASYLSLNKNKMKIFIYYSAGAILFLMLLLIFLITKQIPVKDFILQTFMFPQSIGSERYSSYNLNVKNIFLDYKFIHLVFIIIVITNIILKLNLKDYFKTSYFKIFLVLSVFCITSIFHQIYTKNQIYIFFLIPILSGFSIFYLNLLKFKYKNHIKYFLVFLCVFVTIKYNERFNIERKFHELNNTIISNSVDASKIHKNFNGLNWISPYFENPEEEINLIKSFNTLLEKDKNNKMVISQYNFFASLLNQKIYSPSRTYDTISYPRKNTKYFKNYKSHLINIIKKNNINKIYIFEPFSKYDINEIIFNYIPRNCFQEVQNNEHLLILEILKCREL